MVFGNEICLSEACEVLERVIQEGISFESEPG